MAEDMVITEATLLRGYLAHLHSNIRMAALDSLRARNTRWLKILRHNIKRAETTAQVLDSGLVSRDWRAFNE